MNQFVAGFPPRDACDGGGLVPYEPSPPRPCRNGGSFFPRGLVGLVAGFPPVTRATAEGSFPTSPHPPVPTVSH